MLEKILKNHVLANATFGVVLIVGTLSFFMLPRAQDPEINFNWISVITVMPGASAEDMEKLITDPLEEAIRKVDDIDFVSSNSREGNSNILIRFDDISTRQFDKRLNDLRREVQTKANAELPPEAEDPLILEITSANSFPTAVVLVKGQENDETLRRMALLVKEDIEQISGVDGADASGLNEPELHVEFSLEKLHSYGITATQLADSITAHFQDVSAGNLHFANQEWLVRVLGKNSDPKYIAELPIIDAKGLIYVGDVSDVSRGRTYPRQLVSHDGQAAIMMAITKKPYSNTLELVDSVNQYIIEKNKVLKQLGVQIVLLDDQTTPTRKAIDVMQKNALLGLILVALVTWIFLGLHIAVFIGIGIPFTLAATFWILNGMGETLNQSVLLAIVIVLGMLVDDAVVVVEAIYYCIARGANAFKAAVDALREVIKPVTASVLTTVAAFLPLMLLPGILGDFMFVIPFVVSLALIVSLAEAFWMLPVHVSSFKVQVKHTSKLQLARIRFTRGLRIKYAFFLTWVLRRPKRSLSMVLLVMGVAVILVAKGAVKTEFFAFDPIRLFYVNIEMPAGTPVENTLNKVVQIEQRVKSYMKPGEVREMAAVAGQMFTEMAPFFGSRYGQLIIGLNSKTEAMRGVQQIVDEMRAEIEAISGPERISFLVMSGGPPVSKPISVKVRGSNYQQIRAATDKLQDYLQSLAAVKDITDDDSPGKPELKLRFNLDAVKKSGLNVADLARTLRLLFDGEIVARMQYEGKALEVLVRAQYKSYRSVDELLYHQIPLPDSGSIALNELVYLETGLSKSNIRHYNFRRSITLQADLDKTQMDTVEANDKIKAYWETIQLDFPRINLDFSGELDDIEESLGAMGVLFLFGIGLIYLILGTQFNSYFQPFMVLVTVPLAFTGVVFGLVISGNPLSLFTLYGVVALAGISVNAAIVMIDAANNRLTAGMSVLHATIYAARRRVVPIVITSLTTIAGLFSLATGLGGKSLLWGPVASAIVWGLAFSTLLTLFVIPLIYSTFMRRNKRFEEHKPIVHS